MAIDAGTVYGDLILRADNYFNNLKKADAEMKTFTGKLKSYGKNMEDIGKTLTKKVTLPVTGLVTAAAGVVAAFGWKRLTGLDAAQAQLRGLGYEMQDVERISKQVGDAVRGTTMTMAEGTSVATGALAAGVKEGQELEKYIKLVGSAAVGAKRDVGDMAQIFNRVQGAGKLMTQELNMIEMGMPGFAMAMSNALGVTQEEFRKMVTAGKITSEQFLTVMEDFAGGMADAYADSWAGMVSNTKANIGIIGQNLLEGVFVQSKESIAEFLEMLRSDAAKEWAAETGQKIGEAFNKLVDGAKGLIDWWNGLSDSTKTMIGIMGGVTVAAGPVITVTGKLMQGIEKVNAVTERFGGVVGLAKAALNPWVLGIGAAVVAGAALYSHLSQDAIPAVELFGDEVSESTRKAVGSFLDLEEKATKALTELQWTGEKVTEELAKDIVGNFEGMKKQVLTELEDQRDNALIIMEELFEGSWILSEKDKEEALKITQEKYDGQIEKTEEGHERIKEIIEGAAKDNRELTEKERKEINDIKEEMKKDAVRILSESELEQLAIMERLRAESGKISALQAAEIVKSSYEQKEGAVAEAEDEYNQRLKIAAQLRADGSEEGRILADKIISEAERQRKKSIREAEQMHEGVVEQAKQQAEGSLKYFDWETGEKKKKWEVWRDEHNKRVDEQDRKESERREKMKKAVSEAWTKTKDKALEILDKWIGDRKRREEEAERKAQERRDAMKDAIVKTWESVRDKTLEKIEEMGQLVIDQWEQLRDDTIEWGANLVTGLWTGISDKAKWLYDKVTGFAGDIADRFTSFWKIASDSKLMMEYGNFIVSGLARGIDDNADKPTKAMEKVSKMVEDTMRKVDIAVKNTVSTIEKEFELWKLQNRDLQDSSETLEKQLEMQKQKHDLLTQQIRVNQAALADIIKVYGEGSKQAIEYKNSLLDLQIEHQRLTNSIYDTTDALIELERQEKRTYAQVGVGVYKETTGTSKAGVDTSYFSRSSSDWYTWTDDEGKFRSGSKDDYDDYTGRSNITDSEVNRISREHGVDLGVARDMAAANERAKKKGNLPIYHWGGWVGKPLFDMEGILEKLQGMLGHDERLGLLLDGEYVLSKDILNKFRDISTGTPTPSGRTERSRGDINQTVNIYSPTPLSPSEVARKQLQASRQLAMEWGV